MGYFTLQCNVASADFITHLLQVFFSCLEKGKKWTEFGLKSALAPWFGKTPARDSAEITSPFPFVTLCKHGSQPRTDIPTVITKTLTVCPGARCSAQGDNATTVSTVTHAYNTLLCPLSYLFILRNTHTCSSFLEHQPSQVFWFNPQCPKQCQLHKTCTDANNLLSLENRNETKVNGLINYNNPLSKLNTINSPPISESPLG